MSWCDYRDAPPSGTRLANAADIPERGTLSKVIGGFPVVLVRGAGGVSAFVNACPHQYLPLDHKGDQLLCVDGAKLRCTNHSAEFDALSGEGVEGFATGRRLDRIPIQQAEDGELTILD